MGRILIIGDIHGCYYELQALLDKAGLADGDAVIGIGDIVDRGPETPQVVDFFRTTPNARAVMGNHERKHMRAARHEVKLAISQQISRIQFGPAYPEALEWMSGLPVYIQLEQAVVVHGYFEPGVPLEKQNPSVVCGTMGGDQILRQRYNRPWYELYDADKPVIVGHHNYTGTDRPFVYRDRVFGLDTDCVTGKALTGLLLPSFQFVSVPGRGNLWLRVRRSFQDSEARQSMQNPAGPAWSEEQNRELEFLLQKVRETNSRLMPQIQNTPGCTDLTPRQQSRLFSERVGQGKLANLLQLARMGKLDIDLMRKIVRDPAQLGLLMDNLGAITDQL